jgi:glycosyltransferase involved in cell wall biosynthesis
MTRGNCAISSSDPGHAVTTDQTIAVLVRSLENPGGAQRAMLRYANALAERGHPVDLLLVRGGDRFRSEIHPSIRIVELRRKRLITAVWAISSYLRQARPLTLFSTEPACNTIALLAAKLSRTGVRTVIREGLFPSVAMRESRHRATRHSYRLSRFVYPIADEIVTIATPMADDLATVARLPKSRIKTIAINPVVTPALLEASLQACPHRWFGSRSVPVILGVGRLEPQKDFATLISAFAAVRAHRQCRLVIIGDGGERAALDRQISTLGIGDDVEMLGFLATPYSYMGHCDLFVLSSRYEGLPNVLIEAIACGAPIVSTDCPSGPTDVIPDASYGELVPVGDVQAMAAGIERALSREWDRNRQRERGKLFTIENSINAYIPVLFGTAADGR